jgi:ATP dependent DNA ligase domain
LLKKPPGVLRYSVSFTNKIEELLARAQELGLEGLIGKRAGSRYEAGKRSGAWVKIKLYQEQEFVIGGYTEPEGSRKHFGAFLVGLYEARASSSPAGSEPASAKTTPLGWTAERLQMKSPANVSQVRVPATQSAEKASNRSKFSRLHPLG